MKFKVWDSENKYFIPDNILDSYVVNSKGELCSNQHLLDLAYQPLDKMEIVYFTGQPDKNGIGIHRGDIFKTITGSLVSIIWNETYPIGWCLKYDDQTIIAVAAELLNRSEIIGNKFENPELLEN